MRKQTVNQITFYMLLGSVVNAFSVFVLISLNVHIIEFLMTNFAVNLCIVLVVRDISTKQEMLCNNKNHRLRPRRTPGMAARR